MFKIELVEKSEAVNLLAFAISITGPKFPALLGVSIRNKNKEIDLSTKEISKPGTVICLIENPDELGSPKTPAIYCGEIIFALWKDNTFETNLARTPWTKWDYFNRLCSPEHQISLGALRNLEDKFEDMRKQYKDNPYWTAVKV